MIQRRLAVNRDEAIGKILDGEAIVINLVTGAYYSTVGVGAVIWQGIEDKCSVDDIVATLTGAYVVDADTARADIERLAQEMAAANLIRRDELDESDPSRKSEHAPSTIDRQPYESPVFTAYTDMIELLALDPPMPVFGQAPADSQSKD